MYDITASRDGMPGRKTIMKKQILDQIQNRKLRVGVIGLGYVGLPLAIEFLKQGFCVTGFDVDREKVTQLNRGKSYIRHIHDKFRREWRSKKDRFQATDDFSRLGELGVILVCVPTPLDDHYNPDLSYVIDSTRQIARNLRRGQVVVLESTTYPETTEKEMLPILESSGLKVGSDFYLGYSPEREDPGNRQFHTGNIPKVVSAVTPEGCEILTAFYNTIVKAVPVSSPRVAEASKILENTYRAVNIALVNELKMIFHRMGIDIWEVIRAAETKPFGFSAFYPGPGLGGHCIPIDPFYLAWKAREYDYSTRFIELAGEINTFMPYYVVEQALRILSREGIGIKQARVLIAGMAYKPDIDDLRESPALKILELLMEEGGKIDYLDPYIPSLPKTRKYDFCLDSRKLEEIDDREYDLILILTDHRRVDYHLLITKGRIIIDTRNILNRLGIRGENIYQA